MAEVRRTWIGTVVIDCRRFDEMLDFWKAALGYEQRDARDEGWTLIYDPDNAGPNLAFRKEPKAPKKFWWFHLDLYSSDPEHEVDRLVKLGARILEPAQADRDFVTLADPDGNPFDVVETRALEFGQRLNVPGKAPTGS